MSDKRALDESSNSNRETKKPKSMEKNKNSSSSVESVPSTSVSSISTTDLPGTSADSNKGSYLFATSTFNLEDIEEITTEYPELSGDNKFSFFKIVEEAEAEQDGSSTSSTDDEETRVIFDAINSFVRSDESAYESGSEDQ
ncbi:uncharacterized protein LOC100571841 [Acyrthosiphon pisum]|uniref:Uncharacterized protein n=1 Tax=Acyrthosiphon pisum TaxID=7029 RepID=A0A8R2AB98_ACYPI|nr:uncharacterized protein LOC100571841 [Acyrthosiphon pisum]|eukprot:XP_003244623.1 PREDICTED: uncharacterized protein LOC100571841 [Acyrthosiphon pisum]